MKKRTYRILVFLFGMSKPQHRHFTKPVTYYFYICIATFFFCLLVYCFNIRIAIFNTTTNKMKISFILYNKQEFTFFVLEDNIYDFTIKSFVISSMGIFSS